MNPLYGVDSPEATRETVRLVSATLAVGLLAAAVALALFVWLGYQVRSGEPTAYDLVGRATLHAMERPWLTTVMWAASVYGAPVRLVPVGAVVAFAFAVHGWRRGAMLAVVTLSGALLLDVGLKFAFARARPEAFFDYYPAPSSYSFPSGHALFSTCFFGGTAVLLAHRIRGILARILLWAVAVLLILLIGISRVYLGVHYPTDVLGGYAVGTVWVTAVALGDRILGRRRGT
jgi:undecaprenyl-diphosphatase